MRGRRREEKRGWKGSDEEKTSCSAAGFEVREESSNQGIQAASVRWENEDSPGASSRDVVLPGHLTFDLRSFKILYLGCF